MKAYGDNELTAHYITGDLRPLKKMDALIAYRQYLATEAHFKSSQNATAVERHHLPSRLFNSSGISSLSGKVVSDETYSLDTKMSTSSSADGGCHVPARLTPNQAQIYEYRNKQVIGFRIGDRDMVCLPQVYDLFLKNIVGGLHTVYTKLKRLNIHPVVCNVEQVRALRSYGAILPGVNRCKLIEKDDFEKLHTTFMQKIKHLSFFKWQEISNERIIALFFYMYSRASRPVKRFATSETNPCVVPEQKRNPLAPPPPTPALSVAPEFIPALTLNSHPERRHATEVSNFDISQLFPFAAQHLLMEQLMTTLAARHSRLTTTTSVPLDSTKTEAKSEQSSNPSSEHEQPSANNGSNSSDNTFEWNVERDKTDSTSPHENSITSNDANTSTSSLPTIPGSGLTFNSSNSGSNLGSFSFDREKSTSLANNSGYSSGSSADTPPQTLEIQSFVTKFSKTVDSLEKRFLQQYEKLSALATTLQTTMEKINNREEYLLMKLHQHKERSHHYFRKYLVNRYHLALRRRKKRGKSSKEDLSHEFIL